MASVATGGFVVGIDLGTSNTVAVIRYPDGRRRPVLFDGAPLMPSAVFLQPDGQLAVGRDAQRLAQLDPARYEPNPKQRVDEQAVLLGDREVPTVELLAAVLRAVAVAVRDVTRFPPPVVLTFPASWGQRRRGRLHDAAVVAGWPQITMVPEPVAAARYFIGVLHQPVPRGSAMVVFDFGGGTVDVAVVRNEGDGFAVVGSGGLQDVGGLDIDAALVDHLGQILTNTAPDVWARLRNPTSAQDRRDRRLFWEDIRDAKEMLSRGAAAPVSIPGVEAALHLTREELERQASPMIRRAVAETADTVARCKIAPRQLVAVLLVGGSSRVPLVARMLHRDLGIVPTVLEQPELPVAEGAVVHPAELQIDGQLTPPTGTEPVPGASVSEFGYPPAGPAALSPVSPGPVTPSPVSPGPVHPGPISGAPMSGPTSGGPVSSPPVSPASAGYATQASPFARAATAAPTPTTTATAQEAAPVSLAGRRRRPVILSIAAALAVLLVLAATWALTASHGSNRPQTQNSEPPKLLGSWQRLHDLPVELEGAAAAGFRDKLWVVGGIANDANRSKLKSTWVLDPQASSPTWAKGPDLPAPVSHPALVGFSDGLYVIGGWAQEGGTRQVLRLSSDGQRWETDAPLPEGRLGGAAVWDGSGLIYAGGTRPNGSAADEIWALGSTGWTEIGKLQQARNKLAAVSDQTGSVWFLAGEDPNTHTPSGVVDVMVERKLVQSSLKVDPARTGSGAVRIEGVGVCLIGGEGSNHTPMDWWCDRAGSDRLPKLDLPRAGMAVTVIGKTIYAVGGYNGARAINGTSRADQFTPSASG